MHPTLRTVVTAFALVLLLAWAAGCGDKVVYVETGPGDAAVATGTLNPGDTSLRVVVPGTPPVNGPYVIEGTGIHYDDGVGALVVDLTITNAGTVAQPLPVRVEFVALMPRGVTVLNPDNGIHGPGAIIDFHFTDRDLVWSPGETSQKRPVQFGVEPATSVAFSVRVHLGPPASLGTIAGVVWNDRDEDGVRDDGEPGLPDRDVALVHTDSLLDCVQRGMDCPDVRYAATGPDGSYGFTGLAPGFYAVVTPRDRCSIPTTPTEIDVILVITLGEGDATEVSSFLHADFGVVPVRGCVGAGTAR